MKTVVATLSTVNVAMGLFLMGLFVFTVDNASVVLALAVGLIIQGGYTLWYMWGAGKQSWATRVLLVGQSLALLVGAGGFLISTLNNVAPRGGDPEYGPIVVGAAIATQAAATLYLYAVRREATGSKASFGI